MLTLGIVLLVLGWLMGANLVYVIGLVLTVLGAAFLALDVAGHPVGGRRWY